MCGVEKEKISVDKQYLCRRCLSQMVIFSFLFSNLLAFNKTMVRPEVASLASLKGTGTKGTRSKGAVTGKSKSKKSKKAKKPKKAVKKSFKWRPGTVALREIKDIQKSSRLLLQKAPFQRLVRDSLQKQKTDLWFKPTALEAMQEATESYMVGLFEGAVILQLHRGKKTLTWKDLNYTRRIRGEILGAAKQ